MIAEVLLFGLGLTVLVVGADTAVRSAGDLALYYGVSAFFVGVTVISIGTSVPEMTTSVYGAVYGSGDLVVGNIVGSEVAQITLAVGIVALISPISAERRNTAVYGGAMILAMVIMYLTVEDGVITRSEGFLMMLSYVVFIHDLYSSEGGEEIAEEVEEAEPPKRAVPLILLGVGLVVVGGHLLVTNGAEIARLVGVPEYTVGVLTGLGTTTPEIAVAGLAAHRGKAGISVGSILGSNITDPVFSLGVGALVSDVIVSDVGSVLVSSRYMIGVSVFVLGLLYWRRGISRRTALVCMALYVPFFFV
ncbi:sodium:calcium antiporter [Halorutilales archaeon Cl-col2-1]